MAYPKGFVSVRSASDDLNVSKVAIYRAVRRGDLTYCERPGVKRLGVKMSEAKALFGEWKVRRAGK